MLPGDAGPSLPGIPVISHRLSLASDVDERTGASVTFCLNVDIVVI